MVQASSPKPQVLSFSLATGCRLLLKARSWPVAGFFEVEDGHVKGFGGVAAVAGVVEEEPGGFGVIGFFSAPGADLGGYVLDRQVFALLVINKGHFLAFGLAAAEYAFHVASPPPDPIIRPFILIRLIYGYYNNLGRK